MMNVTVTCTNCNGATEVPKKHAGHFDDNGDGLCEDCHDDQPMPPEPEPKSGYAQVMHDQRGEYKEARRERQKKTQQQTGPVETVNHNPNLNRL